MTAAQGVQTRTQYILPFVPQGKSIASHFYQENLSDKAKLKLKAYQIYKLNKLSMREIAEIFEVNVSTISRWIKQSEKAKQIRRYTILEPKSKAPKNTPRNTVLTSETEKKILTIREKYKCGKDKLSKYMYRDYEIKISPSTIHRYLQHLKGSQ
ncbi:hypothetical protein GF389_06130, partial [Candidatus Dojkabacteria bacterium]|nr:hypothetical protein [Candidatus Dojkabacteria bacterium]